MGLPRRRRNDIYGWIIADLFAGLNIGAVGSTTEVNGQQVGLMDSQQWFTPTQRFAALQPNQPYYNQWAAKMSTLSDAYNFAYTDRFAHVVAPLNPAQVDTLEIVFLPESASTLPGDYNKNDVVDAADYVVWRNGLGTTYTQNDYVTWRTHFGQTAGGASASVSVAVLEPASISMLLMAIVVAYTRLRRQPHLGSPTRTSRVRPPTTASAGPTISPNSRCSTTACESRSREPSGT